MQRTAGSMERLVEMFRYARMDDIQPPFLTCMDRGLPLACVVGGGYSTDVKELVRRHAVLHELIIKMPS
jgi:hypothetical protein